MASINWKATYDTPYISLTPLNVLTISGKSFMDDPYSFYQPVVKKMFYFLNDTLTIELDIKKINTNSKKGILKIIKTAKENSNIKTLKILCLRDPSNEDCYDLGSELEKITEIPIEYLDYA